MSTYEQQQNIQNYIKFHEVPKSSYNYYSIIINVVNNRCAMNHYKKKTELLYSLVRIRLATHKYIDH